MHIDSYLDPNSDQGRKRALSLMWMTHICNLAQLKPKQMDVFEQIAFKRKSITEAAETLGIARMTVHDRYEAAIAAIRRALTNDPEMKIQFEELMG